MPHFVVECSQGILRQHGEEDILARLYRVATATGLFDEADIKVRVNPYAVYAVGGGRDDFIHVFAHIMQGRTVGQRADLSRRIVDELAGMFPGVRWIAANIAEFEKATYVNRGML
jgi:5-carboxymethyl-2-hydroxymuconate isomerase